MIDGYDRSRRIYRGFRGVYGRIDFRTTGPVYNGTGSLSISADIAIISAFRNTVGSMYSIPGGDERGKQSAGLIHCIKHPELQFKTTSRNRIDCHVFTCS